MAKQLFNLFLISLLFLTADTIVNAAPAISNISDNRTLYSNSQIPAYEKFEVTFSVNGSTATNFALPFDAAPPPGVPSNQGITVNAEFSQDNFQNKITVPAFYYQDYDYQVKNNGEWLYPKNLFFWKIRFAPARTGNWQYRITAVDSSGSAMSASQSFSVTSSVNKGFIKPSAKDPRYFEFENGALFPGLGYNRNWDQISWFDPVLKNQTNFQNMGQNGAQLIRHWLSQWGIWSSNNALWHSHGSTDGAWFSPDEARLRNTQHLPDSDVSLALETYWAPCVFMGWLQKSPAIKPNTKYRVSFKYLYPEVLAAADPTKPSGLVAKIGGWLWDSNNYCFQSGTGTVITPYANVSPKDPAGVPQWGSIQSEFTTGSGDFLPNFYLALENINHSKITGAGKYVYVNKVEIREVMADGSVGHDINPNSSVDYHKYFNQRQSYAFDKVLDLAKQNNVYLQLVITEKNEYIQNVFDYNGKPAPFSNNNYYGNWGSPTMISWYQKAWFRYVYARWGYSTNIFSFELLNEGDPYNGLHFTLANELGKFMRQFSPNRPMTSTSLWHSFPVNELWKNPSFPYLDYADVHAYVSSTTLNASNIKDPVVKAACGTDTACYRNYMKFDAALNTSEHSLVYRDAALTKPLVRGEFGLDDPSSQTPDANLAKDLKGTWLHNLLFGTLNSGGMYDAGYWWGPYDLYKNPGPDGNTANGLHEVFKPAYDFISGLPLNNGLYKDAGATISNPGMRVLGQKDVLNNRAHLWIQNRKHIWCAVVGGIAGCPQPSWSGVSAADRRLSGTATLTGFAPNRVIPVEYWQFDEGVNLIGKVTSSITTTTAGNIVLDLSGQPANVTDVAIKIGDYASTVTPTPASLAGDINGDRIVNILDYTLLSNAFGTNNSGADINKDGIVNILDYTILSNNFGKSS